MTKREQQVQRMASLKLANERRMAGVEVRREVLAGQLTIEAALTDPRARVLKIERLLTAQVRWGPARSRAVLDRASIRERKRVGELTDRQQQVLLKVMDDKYEYDELAVRNV